MTTALLFSLGLALLSAVHLTAAIQDDFAVNLLTLVPFTFEGNNHPYYNMEQNNLGFSHMAAALLAMNHFNERNPEVVPQLERAEFDVSNCSIYFSNTSVVKDTHGRGSEAVSVVLDQVAKQQVPGAIAGGYHEESALELSVLTSSLKIPFVAYGGSNIRVVTPYYYPYSSRISADVTEIGEVATSFLFHQRRTNYIGILQASSATALQLMEGIFASATKRGAEVDVVTYIPPVFSGSKRDIEGSMQRLKVTGSRTFVLIVETIEDELQLIADAADKFGLNNGDYVWLIMGDIEIDFFSSADVMNNTNVTKLLMGAGHVKPLDQFTWNPTEDKFFTSWRSQNATFAQKVIDKNPIQPGSPGFFSADDDYFQKVDPEPGAGFLYDAIMSIGMGLCLAEKMGNRSEWSIVASTQLTEFEGATGPVSFGSNDAYPGGRAFGTLTFGAFNILPPKPDASDDARPGYVLTSYLSSRSNMQAAWTDLTAFYFADGSTSPPELRQDPPEQMFLSTWARALGFTLFGIEMLVILGSIGWVYIYRNKRIVKASQPEFLYGLEIGSMSIAVAIILNSFDESYGWTAERLSKLCTATPWLVFSGVVIIYGSLFTKLWRINRLLQFRRVTINVSQVLWPCMILYISALVVLTMWTVDEGFEWVRVEINDSTGETMGKCQGIHSVAYFTPVFVLTVIPVLMTAVMAWKTRDIDSMYSESGWIFILIAVQLQVLVVVIPVIILMEGKATNVRYLGHVSVFFLYPMSTVGLIIGPKIYALHFKPKATRGSHGGSGTNSVHVSGVKIPSTTNLRQSSAGILGGASSGAESMELGSAHGLGRKNGDRASVAFRLQEDGQTADTADVEKQATKRGSATESTTVGSCERSSSADTENEAPKPFSTDVATKE